MLDEQQGIRWKDACPDLDFAFQICVLWVLNLVGMISRWFFMALFGEAQNIFLTDPTMQIKITYQDFSEKTVPHHKVASPCGIDVFVALFFVPGFLACRIYFGMAMVVH